MTRAQYPAFANLRYVTFEETHDALLALWATAIDEAYEEAYYDTYDNGRIVSCYSPIAATDIHLYVPEQMSNMINLMAEVRKAYINRTREYASLLGSMDTVHPSDRHLVEAWADQIEGPILDAGCGPGHWTAHLTERGCMIHGIDQVPDFIHHARIAYPDATFETGTIESIEAATGRFGGILLWYSLIHHHPSSIHIPLYELYRVLQPHGSILLGFFVGASRVAFDHAVTTAYYWSVDDLSKEIASAGFSITETHSRSGSGYRPHGAILATRTG